MLDAERELRSEFLVDSHYVPLAVEVWKEAQDALASGRSDIWSDTRAICKHVFTTFSYKPRSTGVATLATDAFKFRAGVCQDFAHVALGMCRSSGIAARYVSGYFYKAQHGPNEEEASHAWIEAFVPGYGWAAYDPTHDRLADERYVKVASGRDYGDIRPVSGTYRGGKTRSLIVEVRVRQARSRRDRLGLLLLDRGDGVGSREHDPDAVVDARGVARIVGRRPHRSTGRPSRGSGGSSRSR